MTSPKSPTRAVLVVTYEGENVPTSARGYPLGSAHLLTLQERTGTPGKGTSGIEDEGMSFPEVQSQAE